MDLIEKQEWMSDKYWKAFFAISNSGLIDIYIDDNDDIVPRSKRNPLTTDEVDKLNNLKGKCETAWTAQEYARNRAKSYDSVGNQLDQIMKDKRDGTTTHQTACEAVKAQFPKPE